MRCSDHVGLLWLSILCVLESGARVAAAGEAAPSKSPPVTVESGPLKFAEQVLATNYTYAYGLSVGDLDGDGNPDVVSADAEPNSSLYLLRGDGKGGFGFSFIQKYGTGEDQPIRLERHALGDVNGDKLPDVVIVDNLKSDIRWFENPGRAAIEKPWKLHRVAAPKEVPGSYDVALADLDGDGDLDVAASSWVGNRFDWFENAATPGDGSRWVRHQVDQDVGETRTIAIADFDRDGRPDLLGSARTGNLVCWYQNPAKPASDPWRKHVIDAATTAPMHGHPVDLDKDGDLDVIMTYGHATPASADSHQVAWYENVGAPGRGTEWKKHLVAKDFPLGIEVVGGDLDGDGDLDLVATRWSAEGGVEWFENSGDPKGEWKRHPLKRNWSKAITVVLADLDKDGRLDVVAAAERGSNEIRWWRNLGPSTPR